MRHLTDTVKGHLQNNVDLASLVVTYLLEHLDVASIELQTPLHWEARSCNDVSLWNAVLIRAPRLAAYCPLTVNPLPILAEFGHVPQLLQFTSKTWYNVRIGNNRALRGAAFQGHHLVLKLLRTEYGLTAADARARQNEAIRTASARGHVEALRELRLGYGLTRDDAQTLDFYAARAAQDAGHVEVLSELLQF